MTILVTIQNYLKNIMLGIIIGISMLVPGVSGGTIAVIFGIYDELLEAVGNILKRFKHSMFLLSSVALGMLLGFIAAARLISMLLQRAYQPTLYFFMGTILGGVFVLLRQNHTSENKKINYPMLFVGVLIVIGMQLIPEDFAFQSASGVLAQFFMLIFIGLLLAVALILPGISFSMMLVVVGIYTRFITAIETFDWRYLLPIAFSTLFGLLVLSKLLYLFLKNYPTLCNSMIIGFVIASLGEVYPGMPMGAGLVLCIALLCAGFALSWFAVVCFGQKNTSRQDA